MVIIILLIKNLKANLTKSKNFLFRHGLEYNVVFQGLHGLLFSTLIAMLNLKMLLSMEIDL